MAVAQASAFASRMTSLYPETESASAPAKPRVARAQQPPATAAIRGLRRTREGKARIMLLVLALLLVLVLFGAGFALHLLWIVAVVLAVFWVVGFAIGRGEGAGRHRFYRW